VGVDPADYARRLGYMIEVQLRGDPGGATRLERPLLVWLQRAVDKLERGASCVYVCHTHTRTHVHSNALLRLYVISLWPSRVSLRYLSIYLSIYT